MYKGEKFRTNSAGKRDKRAFKALFRRIERPVPSHKTRPQILALLRHNVLGKLGSSRDLVYALVSLFKNKTLRKRIFKSSAKYSYLISKSS